MLPAPDRETILALLDQALRAEARTDTPHKPERRNWLYGSVGYTEPDQHGWMAPLLPKAWMPLALGFWRATISIGSPVSRDQLRDPAYSLACWPEIDEAVGDYLLTSPWLLGP